MRGTGGANSEELRKSQLGAMDCLAMLCWAELHRYPVDESTEGESSEAAPRRPLTEELPTTNDARDPLISEASRPSKEGGFGHRVEQSIATPSGAEMPVLDGLLSILLGRDVEPREGGTIKVPSCLTS
jgi:hypothetical protein